jgi:hypothetical protein
MGLPGAFLVRNNSEKNQITGEIKFEGVTYVEKKAGVWVGGQYLGFLKELKGKRKIVLLPGEHQIIVRRAGEDRAAWLPNLPDERGRGDRKEEDGSESRASERQHPRSGAADQSQGCSDAGVEILPLL